LKKSMRTIIELGLSPIIHASLLNVMFVVYAINIFKPSTKLSVCDESNFIMPMIYIYE